MTGFLLAGYIGTTLYILQFLKFDTEIKKYTVCSETIAKKFYTAICHININAKS
jgi:hypothetical protein